MQSPPDPTALEQISIMIKKYNQLVLDVQEIETLQVRKNQEIEQLKERMDFEIRDLRDKSRELKLRIEVVTKFRTNVAREFKLLVKKDTFNRLSRRIDSLNYENRISHSELNNLLERKY